MRRVKVTTTIGETHAVAMKVVKVPGSKLLEQAIENQVRQEIEQEPPGQRLEYLKRLLDDMTKLPEAPVLNPDYDVILPPVVPDWVRQAPYEVQEVLYPPRLVGSTEEQTIAVIRKYLLTEDQKRWLYDNNLDLADILNGRFYMSLSPEVNKMFDDWNSKVGRRMFGY